MNIEEIALRVGGVLWGESHPRVNDYDESKQLARFAHALLAELSKEAAPVIVSEQKPVAECLQEPGSACRWWWTDEGLALPVGTLLFTSPPNTAEIEQRVAEAFVMKFKRHVGGDGEFWLHELEDFCEDGKWREYL